MYRSHFRADENKMGDMVFVVTQVLGVSAANGNIRNRVSAWMYFMGCLAVYGMDSITILGVVVTLPTKFNIQQFYVLPTQCIYVFCVDLRTNSDYFPIQH